MEIDLERFKKAFFEESYENLQSLETNLLSTDIKNLDKEEINAVFRAAHSIKGGAATFGFTDITQLTHEMETLLDEVRNDKMQLTQEIVALLLRGVDVLRYLLSEVEQKNQADLTDANEVKGKLKLILNSNGKNIIEGKKEEPLKNAVWKVEFYPGKEILLTGNEPYRVIRELERLGKMKIKANLDKLLSSNENYNPEFCYLGWDIEIEGVISKDDIEVNFEWVCDECEKLTIVKSDSHPVDKEEVKGAKENLVAADKKNSLVKTSSTSSVPEQSSIRVDIGKIDDLMNMVAELVITQSMLNQISQNFSEEKVPKLLEGLGLLQQHTRQMQESVMKIRMLPINFLFSRVPRMVFDLSSKLDKQVDLQIYGEQTELDKTVMEKISDPLVHLVRNSIDHGIESSNERKEKGKSEVGILKLNAYHQSGSIYIEISDDGKGLDKEKIIEKALETGVIKPGEEKRMENDEIYNLIFKPGFSTATELSDVSGRGVGMDVVMKNIKSLNGSINIETAKDEGTVITIQLPLTLSILDGQLFSVGEQVYIIPVISIIESLQMESDKIDYLVGNEEVYRLRDNYIPIIRLYDLLGIDAKRKELDGSLLIITESADGKQVGFLVDELLGQQQVVIKSLEDNYRKVRGVSGGAILGDGKVALIVDINTILMLPKKISPAA